MIEDGGPIDIGTAIDKVKNRPNGPVLGTSIQVDRSLHHERGCALPWTYRTPLSALVKVKTIHQEGTKTASNGSGLHPILEAK